MKSENRVQTAARLTASRQGKRLWRNNNGACKDENGRLIRYGLGNDSKRLNSKVKSSDLIGITPVVITQEMVGQTVGIFTSVECKKEGWVYTGTPREVAQAAWLTIVRSMGGIGKFINKGSDV